MVEKLGPSKASLYTEFPIVKRSASCVVKNYQAATLFEYIQNNRHLTLSKIQTRTKLISHLDFLTLLQIHRLRKIKKTFSKMDQDNLNYVTEGLFKINPRPYYNAQ